MRSRMVIGAILASALFLSAGCSSEPMAGPETVQTPQAAPMPTPKDAAPLVVQSKPRPAPKAPERTSLSLACPRARTPPVIDGKLDDACWAGAGEAGNFLLYNSRVAAGQQTQVKVTFDDHNLYVAYICRESEMSKVQATSRADLREGDNDCVWRNDCVELFLDPMLARGDCYQFEVDVLGQTWDALIRATFSPSSPIPKLTEHPEWDSRLKTAAQRGKDGWTVEMAIPVYALGPARIYDGSVWGVNFTRNAPGRELSTWVPWLYDCNFATARFLGAMTLGESPWRLGEVELGAREVGVNRLVAQLRNNGAQTAEAMLFATVSTSGNLQVFTQRAVIPPGKEQPVELIYRIPAPGKCEMSLFLGGMTDKETVAVRSYEFEASASMLNLRLTSKDLFLDVTELPVEVTVRAGDVTRERAKLEVGLWRGTELVRSGAVQGPLGRENDLRLNVAKLDEGVYALTARLIAEDGRLLAEIRDSIAKVKSPFDW